MGGQRDTIHQNFQHDNTAESLHSPENDMKTPVSDLCAAMYEAIDSSPYLHRLYLPYRLICQKLQGETVLDFGCGYGWGTVLLAQHAAQAVGYDRDSRRIAYAAEHFALPEADVLSFTDDPARLQGRRFPWVCLFHVLDHGTDAAVLARQLAAVTAPGGRIWVAAKDLYAPQLQALTDALGGGKPPTGRFSRRTGPDLSTDRTAPGSPGGNG